MADKLDTYRGKRSAGKTPEPIPEAVDPAEAGNRFTIQEHSATRLHWDLRLERDGVLVSFAIPNALPPTPGVNRIAVHTEDHPLEYLDFHGEIPKGQYGAGTMKIWDRGTYETLKWEEGKKIEVHLHGTEGLAEGRYALFPIGGEDGKDWMIHRMDPPADPDAEPMPDKIVPMLATNGKLPPKRSDDQFAYEIKWDGVRAIAYSEPGRLRLESRNLNDITHSYPELARLNRALSHHTAILDGEIVALDDTGKPSFGLLQRRMHVTSESSARRLSQSVPVIYMIFDLLWLDGHSLMSLPYAERRERLAELELSGERWQTPEHIVGNGAGLLAASAQQGLEGVMAKRLSSTYDPGRRCRDWIKVKNKQRDDFTVVGWIPGEGQRRERIGALVLGRDGRFCGRAGSGLDEKELVRLAELLGPIQRDTPPVTVPKGVVPKNVVWVEPRYVAEVEYGEWTSEKILRHPVYKGLKEREAHAPLAPQMVVEGRELKFSNLDKVLYPQTGFTKGDVIAYYRDVSDALLPHLEGRALTLKRYPNGVEGQFFYEKNCPSHAPAWVQKATVKLESKTIDFCLCQDLPTLMWLGNLADLELHTSLALVADTHRPTILAFDLDPGEPATIVECCQVGLWLQGMFERLGLQCFAKTSGSKGLQVYVPLNDDDATYEGPGGTKTFAKAVAELLEQSEPGLVVSRMTKSLRTGKIFVDWSQNDDIKTTVNVYSLRAKDRPTVSTPVTWDEVRACHESQDPEDLVFTADQVIERVRRDGDLFAPVLSLRQQLPKL